MSATTDPLTNPSWLHRAAALVRRGQALLALALALGMVGVAPVHAQDAGALRAQHDQLRDKLANTPFQRPLILESAQTTATLKGDVYAVVDQPFTALAPALQGMEHWCDLLILHLNVKNCNSSGKPPGEVLRLVVGRKFDQPLADAYSVDFNYSVPAATADYLRVQMAADSGPLGTRNYQLALEAVALDTKRSFIHMSYSYSYGLAARIAMQGYLATMGSDKIGFSVTARRGDGKRVYVSGLRGVVERNTMRYYLAIEAYLGALAAPKPDQLEKRLRDWFAATERHPAQLHEIERDEYLAMKHRETQRQQAMARSAKLN